MTLNVQMKVERARRLDCCEPGLFLYKDMLCYKSEYCDYYIVETGEHFWGGCKNKDEIDALVVTPLTIK